MVQTKVHKANLLSPVEPNPSYYACKAGVIAVSYYSDLHLYILDFARARLYNVMCDVNGRTCMYNHRLN